MRAADSPPIATRQEDRPFSQSGERFGDMDRKRRLSRSADRQVSDADDRKRGPKRLRLSEPPLDSPGVSRAHRAQGAHHRRRRPWPVAPAGLVKRHASGLPCGAAEAARPPPSAEERRTDRITPPGRPSASGPAPLRYREAI